MDKRIAQKRLRDVNWRAHDHTYRVHLFNIDDWLLSKYLCHTHGKDNMNSVLLLFCGAESCRGFMGIKPVKVEVQDLVDTRHCRKGSPWSKFISRCCWQSSVRLKLSMTYSNQCDRLVHERARSTCHGSIVYIALFRFVLLTGHEGWEIHEETTPFSHAQQG